MRAIRVRVKLEILATPLYRSQNLRYPYYKEFYGYLQSFFQNVYVDEIAVHYPQSFVYDYWNQQQQLARSLVIYIKRLKLMYEPMVRVSSIFYALDGSDYALPLEDALENIKFLDAGFVTNLLPLLTLSDGSSSYIDNFGMSVNLLRFKFEVGTVFKVTIQSWTLPVTDDGTSSGNPTVAEPYDTDNPNGSPPTPSGDRAPNGEPYGANPPPQSPIDPALDPGDFADPPDPGPGGGTVNLQGWSFPAIPGVQSAGFAVACPGATLADAIPALASIQQSTDLGVKPITIDAQGNVSAAEVISSFPGFQFNTHFFAADTSCGVNGTY